MFADLLSWLPLLAKLLLTAAIVVSAAAVTERAGPVTGALVATLPVTIWPAYVFLSLDHDSAFIAEAARSGIAVNAITAIFLLVYAALAQKRGLVLSFIAALGCWIAFAILARSNTWTLATAGLLNLMIFVPCLWLARSLSAAKMPPLRRAWFDLPLRTLLVCALMAAILQVSTWAGPVVTGILAVYPISSTSLMLILHPRIGGLATAAVMANSLWGLIGISAGLAALSLAIGPLGSVPALAAALVIPMAWNLTLWALFRRE
jgi:hypothetical protein